MAVALRSQGSRQTNAADAICEKVMMLSESKRKRHPPKRSDRKRRELSLSGMLRVESSESPKDNEETEPDVRAGSSLVPSDKGEGNDFDATSSTAEEPQPEQIGVVNSQWEITRFWSPPLDLFEQDADVPLRHISNLFEEDEARQEPAGTDLFHADFKDH